MIFKFLQEKIFNLGIIYKYTPTNDVNTIIHMMDLN